jgi:hypothetical protein
VAVSLALVVVAVLAPIFIREHVGVNPRVQVSPNDKKEDKEDLPIAPAPEVVENVPIPAFDDSLPPDLETIKPLERNKPASIENDLLIPLFPKELEWSPRKDRQRALAAVASIVGITAPSQGVGQSATFAALLREIEEQWVVSEVRRLGGLILGRANGTVSRVKLHGTKFTDHHVEALAWLPRLRELSLSGTNVTDAVLKQLGGLKRLEVLDLRGTRVTKKGVEGLRKALPGCRIKF